jgi:hypothetical protein
LLQQQPGLRQSHGVRLPHTAHLTITPVTESVLAELTAALVHAADDVRGVPPVDPAQLLAALPPLDDDSGPLTAEEALELLQGLGIGGGAGADPGADPGGAALPEQMAPLLALIEALPSPVTEQLLVELLARLVEPGGDRQASVRGGA